MLVGVRVGPGSPAVLLVVGRVRWVTGWPYNMAALVAHRQRARVTGAWFDSGYMFCVSSWVLVPYCTSFLREGELGSCGRLCLAPWCVGLRVTLMEKCAQSTLQLPSELVVARGNLTLRPRAPCFWQLLVRCLGLLFMAQCLVQQWVHVLRQLMVLLEGFLCEVELESCGRYSSCSLGASQFGEVFTVSASGCLGCYTLKS